MCEVSNTPRDQRKERESPRTPRHCCSHCSKEECLVHCLPAPWSVEGGLLEEGRGGRRGEGGEVDAWRGLGARGMILHYCCTRSAWREGGGGGGGGIGGVRERGRRRSSAIASS